MADDLKPLLLTLVDKIDEVLVVQRRQGDDIGQLKTDVGQLKVDVDRLDKKIDAVSSNLNAKIDAVSSSLNAKIDAVSSNLNAKIDAVSSSLNAKIDAVSDDLNVKHDSLSAGLKNLESEMRQVKEVVGATRMKEIARLDGRIDQLTLDVGLGRPRTAAE